MPLIDWREEFALGLPDVDHEHRELIELINETHAKMSAASNPDLVTDFLGEIHARIAAHFALEEKIMRDLRYDGATTHKEDHERLLDEIRDIMDACEQGAGFDSDHLAGRLEAWFTNHFKTEDARLHKHLA